MHVSFKISKWIKRQFRNISLLLIQPQFDHSFRLYEDEIGTLMGIPNESLNHLVSKFLNIKKLDFFSVF